MKTTIARVPVARAAARRAGQSEAGMVAVIQKLIPLKYADPRTVTELLRIFDVESSSSPTRNLHALAVKGSRRRQCRP